MPKKIKNIIKAGQEDEIHKRFSGKAVLVIYKDRPYGWIQLGKMRYYFHKSGWASPYEKEIETIKGEKLKAMVIPYDGWEYGCEDLEVKFTNNPKELDMPE